MPQLHLAFEHYSVGLIENMPYFFFLNITSNEPFSVTSDVIPNF